MHLLQSQHLTLDRRTDGRDPTTRSKEGAREGREGGRERETKFHGGRERGREGGREGGLATTLHTFFKASISLSIAARMGAMPLPAAIRITKLIPCSSKD